MQEICTYNWTLACRIAVLKAVNLAFLLRRKNCRQFCTLRFLHSISCTAIKLLYLVEKLPSFTNLLKNWYNFHVRLNILKVTIVNSKSLIFCFSSKWNAKWNENSITCTSQLYIFWKNNRICFVIDNSCSKKY